MQEIPQDVRRANGGKNIRLHVICDSHSQSLNLFVTAGQVSDYITARAFLSSVPHVGWLLSDWDFDAGWFKNDVLLPGYAADYHVGGQGDDTPDGSGDDTTSGAKGNDALFG